MSCVMCVHKKIIITILEYIHIGCFDCRSIELRQTICLLNMFHNNTEMGTWQIYLIKTNSFVENKNCRLVYWQTQYIAFY